MYDELCLEPHLCGTLGMLAWRCSLWGPILLLLRNSFLTLIFDHVNERTHISVALSACQFADREQKVHGSVGEGRCTWTSSFFVR